MLKFKNKFINKNHLVFPKNKIKSSKLHFGQLAIISIENKFIGIKEIDSIKKFLLKKIKGKAQLITKITPFVGVTSKPNTRLGKGKGAISNWVYPIRRGFILFEIKCYIESISFIKKLIENCQNNLSFKTKIIEKYYKN